MERVENVDFGTGEPKAHPEQILRSLARVRWLGLADAVLLVVLVAAALSGAEDLVSVLGPIHGVGYILLLLLAASGAGSQLWGWWYPLLIVVTLGPPGTLIGDRRIRRALGAA